MKSGKRKITAGIELLNHERIRTLGEKENYKYLGILEADTTKQAEMKKKNRKEYLKRTRKLLKTKFCSRNLSKKINTWAILLVIYSGLFLKWTREELQQMNQTTRKIMTMHSALHQIHDLNSIYVPRKVEGKAFARIKDSVDASVGRLEYDMKKSRERLITVASNSTDNIKTKITVKVRNRNGQKKLRGYFKRQTGNISHKKT